jgi:hypothetical protein|tara:strand:- start:291 stop:575 length:285 start_codon:yes stop_codon:yes gene_type:complete
MTQFKYNHRYCNAKTLCKDHGFGRRTLERWISETNGNLPGRIKLPGVRSYIYDPVLFHDTFLLPKLNEPVRNEYEGQEHLAIITNLKQLKGTKQ